LSPFEEPAIQIAKLNVNEKIKSQPAIEFRLFTLRVTMALLSSSKTRQKNIEIEKIIFITA
jgi:hypothetical protein